MGLGSSFLLVYRICIFKYRVKSIPHKVWFLAAFILPESPRWLALNGQMAKAEQVLAKITAPEELKYQVDEINDSLKSTNHHSLSILEQVKLLLSPTMRTALVIGLVVTIIQPLHSWRDCGADRRRIPVAWRSHRTAAERESYTKSG